MIGCTTKITPERAPTQPKIAERYLNLQIVFDKGIERPIINIGITIHE